LQTILHPHDVNEVLKIRLSGRVPEDYIAWHYEKSGIFSVRSAYHLAVQLDRADQNQAGCSTRPDGSRPVFKEIWAAAAPLKVRMFVWRLSQEALTTQTNRKKQTLERDAVCQICGMEEESGYHAVVRCTKAVALRHEMRRHWSLSGELQFQYTGPDWLPQMLSMVDKETKARILLLFWRVWHLRNDVHGQGRSTVAGSAEFLKHYAVSLGFAGQARLVAANEKGKEKMEEGGHRRNHSQDEAEVSSSGRNGWAPPTAGWAKLNTDAGFCADTGKASSGIVVRDINGKVLLSAWRTQDHMASAKESEAVTCLEGIRLTAESGFLRWWKLTVQNLLRP
jgi:hypothetical protein